MELRSLHKLLARLVLILGAFSFLQSSVAAPEDPANVSATDDNATSENIQINEQEQKLLEQLATARKTSNRKLEVGVLGELGLFYFQSGQFIEAESKFLQTIDLAQKALGPNHADVARAYANLGFVYEHSKNFKKAEPVLLKAMGILAKTKKDDDCLAKVLGALGDLCYAKGDFATADQYYGRALTLLKSLKRNGGESVRIQENRRRLRIDMQNRKRTR